jgi:hypothetical protein
MSVTSHSQIEETAVDVLKHFQQEERMLADMLRSTEEVRAALLSRDLHTQHDAFREHFKPPAKLHEWRQDLRKRIAESLNTPVEEATLRGLADRAPRPLGEELVATHERLLNRIAEIDRLNRANAVLAAYFIDVVQKLLGDPANQRSPAKRYSPSGEVLRDDNSKHSGLQVRC